MNKHRQILTTIGYEKSDFFFNVRIFFTESVCKERSSEKPIDAKIKWFRIITRQLCQLCQLFQ